ncbi:hypothetical protein [Hydrogenoanaerobacterium sp.]|uniref:hypothetical protein n=1 Tax=Hydrogenoanaerobacterium sp. TaxID=2953763 RepID=UPI00289A0015|nr:hypothetical protein [Hydrogenoanaerobacterium sp.]
MRTGLPVTMLSLVAAVALSFALVKWSTPNQPVPMNQEAQAVPIENSADYEYLLKDYRGRLAVFHRGATDPDLIFDVYIQSLPDFDRGQLKNGVAAKDYSELVALIEDYTS